MKKKDKIIANAVRDFLLNKDSDTTTAIHHNRNAWVIYVADANTYCAIDACNMRKEWHSNHPWVTSNLPIYYSGSYKKMREKFENMICYNA